MMMMIIMMMVMMMMVLLVGSVSFSPVYEPLHEKTCLREFPTRSGSNWPAQLQKLARALKFWLYNLEILYYLSSEQQRR